MPSRDAAAVRHTGTEEVIAETTAYVLVGLCGLDTAAYSQAYVAGWAEGNADTVRAVGQAVTGVHTIIGRLADAIAHDPELAACLPGLGTPQSSPKAFILSPRQYGAVCSPPPIVHPEIGANGSSAPHAE